jgi:hypothetical protein
MELQQQLQIVQFLIILIAGCLGIFLLWNKNSPERKYILLFCLIDIPIMAITSYYYTNQIYFKLFWLYELLFSWCEIFLISFYISDIISKNKKILPPALICIICPALSFLLLKNLHEIPLLASNIYLTYYVFLYFRWIFTSKTQFNLLKASHFWIVLGVCLCYSTTIPYWITELIIWTWGGMDLHEKIDLNLFSIFIILNMIMYILFIRSFFLVHYTVKSE